MTAGVEGNGRGEDAGRGGMGKIGMTVGQRQDSGDDAFGVALKGTTYLILASGACLFALYANIQVGCFSRGCSPWRVRGGHVARRWWPCGVRVLRGALLAHPLSHACLRARPDWRQDQVLSPSPRLSPRRLQGCWRLFAWGASHSRIVSLSAICLGATARAAVDEAA